jgi:ring-1,2-phenylacetyl-CoA epoxidase subunit PaaE
MTPKFHQLEIIDVNHETEDTVSVSFYVPKTISAEYSFFSGQYLTLKRDIDGEEVRRSYSLCSSPFENEWRIAIKRVENGKFSNFALNNLKAGDLIDVMTPAGNFKIQPNVTNEKSYVLFAAGSGITPIISIAKTILKEEPNSDVTLFYGNKGFQSIIFREILESLKNTYIDRLRIIHILSRESLGNNIQKGRIDKQKTFDLHSAFLKGLAIDSVYICGPEEMIIGVKEGLLEKGIDASKIHFELFTSGSANKPKPAIDISKPAIASKVSIVLDGDKIDLALSSHGETILDAAQKAGADLPFACKGGVCCTCKAKIITGTARMDVNYALEKDEVEQGYILTCQAHPTSEELIVSFDD